MIKLLIPEPAIQIGIFLECPVKQMECVFFNIDYRRFGFSFWRLIPTKFPVFFLLHPYFLQNNLFCKQR